MALQSSGSWQAIERALAEELLEADPIDRVTWHAQKSPAPTRELRHVRLIMPVPRLIVGLALDIQPNLPWAEDHFQERVSGEALNPPPSHNWWPFAERGNNKHMAKGRFSHTYPERYWPNETDKGPVMGVRYVYGDLGDLLELFRDNAMTRQAYLPVWFPEDLFAASSGERVPCSLGYHFLMQPDGRTLDVSYSMRSVDFKRHLRDDVYMACRLLQWVCGQLNDSMESDVPIIPGQLVMTISSLHCFPPDEGYLREL